MGVLPKDVYHMTYKEANIFLYERDFEISSNIITVAWKTVNFVGLLIGDKLKDLNKYLPKRPKGTPKRQTNDVRQKILKTAIKKAKDLGDIPKDF